MLGHRRLFRRNLDLSRHVRVRAAVIIDLPGLLERNAACLMYGKIDVPAAGARGRIVERTVFAEAPPRVEYHLTKTGHSLLKPIEEISV